MSCALIDPFDRPISYLRLSVTDRCDFRCTYCMSEDMTFLPKTDLLNFEELSRLCDTFIDLGIRKLRITGGEPLVRRDIMALFRAMGRHVTSGGLQELTLTTNGSQLARYAQELADCGVRRVNVSLDTLNPAKFAALTRRGRLDQVLDGIRAAQSAGMRVKINAVALRGINEAEIPDLVQWCAREDLDLTFIEVMPMGDIGGDMTDLSRLDTYLPLGDVQDRLSANDRLIPLPHRTGGPARYMQLASTGQQIGFITPLSHNFCESCNRVRVSCTGQIYTCLGQEGAQDLRAPLRASTDDAPLRAAIQDAIARKPKGHDFDYSRGTEGGRMSRHMSHTGG